MNNRKHILTQVVVSVLCAAAAWKGALDIDGSEFVGGRITGRLFEMQDVAFLLFLIAALVSFFFRRIGAGVLLLSCVLCLPLDAYLISPGLFRRIFPGEYSAATPALTWNLWATVSLGSLMLAFLACLYGLRIARRLS